MRPYILYPESVMSENQHELASLERLFPGEHGSDVDSIPAGSVVFPRYRQLPYGEFLEEAVIANGSVMVNTWSQYQYIAGMFGWVSDLGKLTPPAYLQHELESLPEGEYFIKGVTNSLKHQWAGASYASTAAEAKSIVADLAHHPLLGSQDIVVRPFVHYRQLATSTETGQPIFNEWRVFVFNGQVLASGFYWDNYLSVIPAGAEKPLNPSMFDSALNEAIVKTASHVSFVVIDLAELPDGSWQVIELNDANMAGFCAIDPNTMWQAVAQQFATA